MAKTDRVGRIALMGGSFDPVHRGHLAIAAAALRDLGVDAVMFVPAKISPLKEGKMVASDEDRLNMLRLALRGERRFSISDCEIRRSGISYTIDTVRELGALHPGRKIVFLAGMDSLLSLKYWKCPEELVSICDFVTFARPGAIVNPSTRDIGLSAEVSEKLIAGIIRTEFNDVSSTMIRDRIAQGMDISGLVPPDVFRYIRSRGLYGYGV